MYKLYTKIERCEHLTSQHQTYELMYQLYMMEGNVHIGLLLLVSTMRYRLNTTREMTSAYHDVSLMYPTVGKGSQIPLLLNTSDFVRGMTRQLRLQKTV